MILVGAEVERNGRSVIIRKGAKFLILYLKEVIMGTARREDEVAYREAALHQLKGLTEKGIKSLQEGEAMSDDESLTEGALDYLQEVVEGLRVGTDVKDLLIQNCLRPVREGELRGLEEAAQPSLEEVQDAASLYRHHLEAKQAEMRIHDTENLALEIYLTATGKEARKGKERLQALTRLEEVSQKGIDAMKKGGLLPQDEVYVDGAMTYLKEGVGKIGGRVSGDLGELKIQGVLKPIQEGENERVERSLDSLSSRAESFEEEAKLDVERTTRLAKMIFYHGMEKEASSPFIREYKEMFGIE